MFNVFTSLRKKAKNNHISCIFAFRGTAIFENLCIFAGRNNNLTI